MRKLPRERIIHMLFDISVIMKGLDGVLEMAGGILLIFLSPEQVHNITRLLTLHELREDPHDIIANYLLHSSQHLSVSAEMFGAVYLLWHGLVKVALVTALLLRQKWAYPSAIVAFFLFLSYQLYRYSQTHAPELLVLSAVDILVIVFTWLEYSRLRALHTFS